MAPKSKISPPDGISTEAKKLFVQLVKDVDHRWETYHAHALALYCETYCELGRMRNALRELKNEAILIVRNDGQQQLTPLIAAIKEYTKLVRELGAELGLSPVSEAKSKLDGPPPKVESDALADLNAFAEGKRRAN